MTDIPSVPTFVDGLEPIEAAALKEMADQLNERLPRNADRRRLYEFKYRFQQLGIAVPPQFQGLDVVIGWPAQAVDVLSERLRPEGVILPGYDDIGIDDIWNDNRLSLEAPMAHTDAGIYGPGFVVISAGGVGEPDVLITVEPASSMTALWDRRARRVQAALLVGKVTTGRVTAMTLFQPNQTIELTESNGVWSIERKPHNLGRVPVVPLINRPRSDRPWGASEITRGVIAYSAGAVRTLLAAEISREYYASPQRYILGADDDTFKKPDGSTKNPWEVYLGRYLALTRNWDQGETAPVVGQFTPSSPQPYIDQVKMYSQLMSAETAIPAHYLGFVTDNPASAEAIQATESRLVMRAKDRQDSFGWSWAEAMRIALLIRDGGLPETASQMHTLWKSPGTPTPAADTDAAIKKVQAGILPAGSRVVLEELGYSQVTIDRIESDAREAASGGLVESIKTLAAGQPAASTAADDAVAEANAMKARLDALGSAIRSGVKPESAAKMLGFEGLEFTGAVPVTLRLPQSEAEQLEDA